MSVSVCNGIRLIKKPDYKPQVFACSKPKLIVIENGQGRSLRISQKVAEVLIADGYYYSRKSNLTKVDFLHHQHH